MNRRLARHDQAVRTYVNVTGDTMTGLLVLSGDPVAPLNPVTLQFADAAYVNVTGDTVTGKPDLRCRDYGP